MDEFTNVQEVEMPEEVVETEETPEVSEVDALRAENESLRKIVETAFNQKRALEDKINRLKVQYTRVTNYIKENVKILNTNIKLVTMEGLNDND